MTDNAAETAPPTTEGVSAPPENTTPEPANVHEHGERPGREAQALRGRLRESEASRETLAATVAAMNIKAAERIANTILVRGNDLWSFNVDVSTLLGDDGLVDEAKVEDAANALVVKRAYLGRRSIPQGDTGARGGQPETRPVGWGDLFRG